jgi:hypothetical protein
VPPKRYDNCTIQDQCLHPEIDGRKMDESPCGTDSYLVVQSLPTFDDMRFKTPLNKVKAADPDFLDPSSGRAVDRVSWMC